jgi:TonB family protein
MKSTLRRFIPAALLPGWGFACLLALGTALPAAETPAGSGLKPPSPLVRVPPVHPVELKRKFVSGSAVVECLVTEAGTVDDIKVISATQREFGEAAEEALRHWMFRPAERDGRPVALRINIPFDFTLPNDWIIENLLQREVFQEVHEDVIDAKELPSWPRPLQFILPKYPESLKGSGKYGKAVVSITINKEGKVMNPKIKKATYPEFVLPALIAASRLEFPPQIMANNVRIYVSMDLQFDFKAEPKDQPKDKPKEKSAKK